MHPPACAKQETVTIFFQPDCSGGTQLRIGLGGAALVPFDGPEEGGIVR